MSDAIDLELLSGFTNYGGVYPNAGYKDLGSTVFLQGLVTRDLFGTEQAPLPVVQLPEEARPETSLTFSTFAGQADRTSYSTARVDVGSDGLVTFLGLIEYDEWATLLSLSGITFPVSGTTRVPADGSPPPVDPPDIPLLTPGVNYFFRLADSYEFEATLMRVESATKRGRPPILVVQRGLETGFLNLNSVAVAWARPGLN